MMNVRNMEWKIKAWGKCHPTDCFWGEVNIALLGSSVIDKAVGYGLATWDFNISTVFLTVKLDGDKLIVQNYSIFKDNSERSNYSMIQLMERSEEIDKTP